MSSKKTVLISVWSVLLIYQNLINSVNPLQESAYYRAAVIEVVPFTDSSLSPIEVVRNTLALYEQAVNVAKSENVDIIVFPETVLFIGGRKHLSNRSALLESMAVDTPDPRTEECNPCSEESNYPYLLRRLSCLAKEGGMFLVANVIDYKRCKNFCEIPDVSDTVNCREDEECPEDGLYFYNTNVVFNRDGKLVVRYHKKHLYFEPLFRPSEDPEHGFFETDFGNFTTFICFDIAFGVAVDAIEQTQAPNLAFPFFWHDHTPLLYFAPAFQQSFAALNKINLLAANGHVPGTGTLGSGIFSSSNGALISTYNPDSRSKILVSNVPKDPKADIALNENDLNRKRYSFENGSFHEDHIEETVEISNQCEVKVIGPPKDNLMDHQCYSMNLTSYKFAKLQHPEGTIEVCSNDFCCSVTYKADSMEEDYFLAVSGEPLNLYEKHLLSAESCFLTRCISEDGNTCSSFLLKSETVFETAELRGNFSTTYVYPLSLDSHLRLTKKDKWIFDGKFQIFYNNLKQDSSLLFLSLNGRKYYQDSSNLN